MSRILPFSDWLAESASFPPDWRELPEWKLLTLMGFDQIPAPSRESTVSISSPYTEKTIRLTPAGYVRTAAQGFAFQTKFVNPMPKLLGYVIERYAKKGLPLVSPADLDALVKAHPELLTQLNEVPEIKSGVMKRTGLSDPQEILYRSFGITHSTVKWLDKGSKNSWILDPATGEVDVVGSFSCQGPNKMGLRGVRFREVGGNFDCSHTGLKSLEGAPQKVAGDFNCSNNNLSSLEGGPQSVAFSYICWLNPLTSLAGAPAKIGTGFHCDFFSLKEWNPREWLGLLSDKFVVNDKQKAKSLILPIVASHMEPRALYDFIQSQPDRLALMSIIKNSSPEIWDRIKGFGKTGLSAEAGDLYF